MSILKKLAVVFGISFLILLAAVAILPSWVDVDQYRPKLVDALNRKVRGKVELGRLELSLWGQMSVRMGGLRIFSESGEPMLSVDEARWVLPLASLIAGSPRLTLEMRRPTISSWNWRALLRTASPESGDTGLTLPGILGRARLGLRIRDGELSFQGGSGSSASLRDVDVEWINASLVEPSRMKLGFLADCEVAGRGRISGPVGMSLELSPVVRSGEVEALGLLLDLDATHADLVSPVRQIKKAGVPARVISRLAIDASEVRLDEFRAVVDGSGIDANGRVRIPPASDADPQVALKLSSSGIRLEPFGLSGRVDFDAQVQGASSALSYSGRLGLASVAIPIFDKSDSALVSGKILFSTGRLDDLMLSARIAGSELSVVGDVIGFDAPRFNLKVSASSMDTEAWRALDPIRRDPRALAASGAFSLKVKSTRFAKTEGANLEVNASVKPGMAIGIEQIALNAFGGRISATGQLDLKPVVPSYRFSGQVRNVELQKAVGPTWMGRLSASFKGSGEGFDADRAISRLRMDGRFSVAEGRLAPLDVARLAVDSVNEALPFVSESIPSLQLLRDRLLGAPRQVEPRYERISSRFVFKQGRLTAADFLAVPRKESGFDLKGRVSMDLVRRDFDARLELIDTFNLTGARDVSIELDGRHFEAILAEPGKPVRIPLAVGCKWAQPCPSYGEVGGHLAKVVGENIKRVQ